MNNAELEQYHPEVDRVLHLRGWFIHCFAQIEFMLGELISVSLASHHYDHLDRTFPFGVSQRIDRVEKILAASGPLAPFEGDLGPLLSAFKKSVEDRNVIAHGYSEFHVGTDGTCAVRFLKWQRDPKGHRHNQLYDVYLPVEHLQKDVESLCELADKCMSILSKIRGGSPPVQ
ncbi:hypothetical protein [Novosphingobium sp. PC22D]|uniref:hypothetical protein n=1 Tax=Novosphingobium sp. PC22D TaxID=1962403 RepID=UPI00114588F6|nr:hypothetical protein [Novosphingobium sp. PC22D]